MPGQIGSLLFIAFGGQGGGDGSWSERARDFPAHPALGQGQARDEPLGASEDACYGGAGLRERAALAPGQAAPHCPGSVQGEPEVVLPQGWRFNAFLGPGIDQGLVKGGRIRGIPRSAMAPAAWRALQGKGPSPRRLPMGQRQGVVF